MNRTMKFLSLVLLIALSAQYSAAQSTTDPVDYMKVVGKEMDDIKKDMWDYTSAVAHGKSAKKVETKRKDLLNTIREAKSKVSSMPAFKGDAAFRDSTKAYLVMGYNVINDDYGKIVDMEAIAEQSYDAMEAYLTAQEMANQKLDAAGDVMAREQKEFAIKYGITLLEDKDKVTQKLQSATRVIKYYNAVYLVFFKSFKQEAYAMEAISKNDVNGLQQNSNSMVKIAQEGLMRLDTMKAFDGDGSLLAAAREVLRFHEAEAKDKFPTMTDYFMKRENFDKIKKAYDGKSASKHTQDDVDAYNKAVNEMNAGVNAYNATNNELNKKRSATLDGWNKAVTAFLDKNTPKYK